ncbi:MAG: PBECR2 nuclease fold domain-containing protein [Treponema sp.]|nr:PBECR2 nuclease fold domain-containing protein [Treponema sp.]
MNLLFFLKSNNGVDKRLQELKKKIIAHLQEEDTLEKSIVSILEKGGMATGTIREWKGKKYIKGADGKWRRHYNKESRGAKISIKNLIKKVEAINSAEGLMKLILLHRDRFCDNNGSPIPLVQELSRYISERQGKLNPEPKPKKDRAVAAKTPDKQILSDAQKEQLKNKFESMAVEMEKYEFTEDNYKKLFPNGKINTPIGEVKLGEHQFDKLKAKERTELLGAIKQTLEDPITIFASGDTEIYAKSFIENQETKAVISVVIEKEGKKISISTHRRGLNNVINKIKEGNILYEKNITLTSGHAHASKKQDNASAETTPNMDSGGGSLKTGDQNHPHTISPKIDEKSREKSEEEKHRNRSEGMKGNKNAYKGGSKDDIKASKQVKTEQENGKKARKKAGMPPTGIFERTSAMEDSTWNPNSADYRYRDTGYIAGSRKELAVSQIRSRAKAGEHILTTEIDWQAIEENPRQAKQLITKSNIFGKVDWDGLKENGMSGSAAFLVDRVYASVGAEPAEDNAESRHNYSIAIDGLRARLELCKTVDEVTSTIKEIKAEMNGDFIAARETPEVLELSKQLNELYQQRQALITEEGKILGWRTQIETELDKIAADFYNQEVDKIKAKDKRKKHISEYDFPAEAKAKYERLKEESRQEKIERLRKFKEEHNWLEDEDFSDKNGSGWRRRGYFYNEIKELEAKRKELYDRKAAEIIISNPLHLAWTSLGSKFQGVLNYGTRRGSETFYSHVSEARRGKHDNWEWAGKERVTTGGGQKRRVEFELKVASKLERKGGRPIKAESTLELKNLFNLRDVQSGNWVLNDPESAKFHVDNITSALADLGDMTGISDDLISLNGRLALAIGARGSGNAGWKGSAAAHYEPVERVINLTKMRGGGNLGHEWFHAFDNLLTDAMTGGNTSKFLTDPNAKLNSKQLKLKKLADDIKVKIEAPEYAGKSDNIKKYLAYEYEQAKKKAEAAGVVFHEKGSDEDHIERVKAAFNNLVKTMVEGNTPIKTKVRYTESDYNSAKRNFGDRAGQFATSIRDAGSLDNALEIIYKRGLPPRNQKEWILITTAWYDKNPNGNAVSINSGEKASSYKKCALDLDGGGKPYFSSTIELAARAFSAFIDDKLRESNRLNDYLAYATTNEFYKDPLFGDQYPYPEGEERERINTAMEQLFRVVKETGAIRKAIMADFVLTLDKSRNGLVPQKKQVQRNGRTYTTTVWVNPNEEKPMDKRLEKIYEEAKKRLESNAEKRKTEAEEVIANMSDKELRSEIDQTGKLYSNLKQTREYLVDMNGNIDEQKALKHAYNEHRAKLMSEQLKAEYERRNTVRLPATDEMLNKIEKEYDFKYGEIYSDKLKNQIRELAKNGTLKIKKTRPQKGQAPYEINGKKVTDSEYYYAEALLVGIEKIQFEASKKGSVMEKSDNKLEVFRKKILDHLESVNDDDDTKELKKSLIVAERTEIKKAGRGLPVGTIRDWKGQKYIKTANGKWKPKYDSHNRGAKMAVSAIKKKITAAKDAHEMMQIILANRDRFSDKDGHPLPFVQELSEFVRNAQIENAGNKFDEDQKKGKAAGKEYKKLEREAERNRKNREKEKIQDSKKQIANEPTRADILKMGKNELQNIVKEKKQSVEIINYARKELNNRAVPVDEDGEFLDEKIKKYREKPEYAFLKIKNKYIDAKSVEGDEDEIQVGKDTVEGKWKLVEADAPTASHDEKTFSKTPGFPANADGSSINDRDYEHFEANKEAVWDAGNDYDGRALQFDNPVVVTTDGIVISGNNRTMSSKIAAKRGTDKAYIEALKKRAKKFGFSESDLSGFKNPRVVFEVEQKGDYSTEQFAKFNEKEGKEQGPTEKAAKVSKMIKMDTIEAVSAKIEEFETIGELYQDVNASRSIFNMFLDAGLIGKNETGRYFENGNLTDDGKTFIETALLGTVINEANLRGFNRPGCKSIRSTLLRALIPLVENKGMTGYSINGELNSAVDVAMQVAINKDKFKSVEEFSLQNNMFESLDPVSVELAKRIEGGQKAFAEFMKTMNGGLKVAANGEADIFLGGVESREDILGRMLNIKALKKALQGLSFVDEKSGERYSVEEALDRLYAGEKLSIGMNGKENESIRKAVSEVLAEMKITA